MSFTKNIRGHIMVDRISRFRACGVLGANRPGAKVGKLNFLSLVLCFNLTLLSLFFSTGVASAQQRTIINQGFEQNDGVGGIILDTLVPGWSSTNGSIEVWWDGRLGVPSSEGAWFVELNPQEPVGLFQEICLQNGEELSWSFDHRARGFGGAEGGGANPQVAEYAVVSLDGLTTHQLLATQSSNIDGIWHTNAGITTYNGPSGVQRLEFRSTNAGSEGNFLDAVQITLVGFGEGAGDATSELESVPLDATNGPSFRISGTVTQNVDIPVSVVGGTATAGVDYNLTSTFITIPAGTYDGVSANSFFPVPVVIVSDAIQEGSETIVFEFGSPSNSALELASLSCATVIGSVTHTILDPVIDTSSPNLCVNNGGTLTGASLFTEYDNGTFGTGSGAIDDIAAADPYPAIPGYTFTTNIVNNVAPQLANAGHYTYVSNHQTAPVVWGTGGQTNIKDPLDPINGRVLMANGLNTAPDTPFLTINLTGLSVNTNYEFSFLLTDLLNINNTGPATELSVYIDDVKSFDSGQVVHDPAGFPVWKKLGAIFNTGVRTSVVAELRVTDPTNTNDFAVDVAGITECVLPNGIISGSLYYDQNESGVFDPTETTITDTATVEVGGVIVSLYDDLGTADPTDDAIIAVQVVDSSGYYEFSNVLVGTNYYVVLDTAAEILGSTYILRTPNPVTSIDVTDGGVNAENDFGYGANIIETTKTVSLADTNGNGVEDAGDLVTYTITIQNTGTYTLTQIGVDSDTLTRRDPGATILTLNPDLTHDSSTNGSPTGTLIAGETATYLVTYTLVQADIDAGGISNTATGIAETEFGTFIVDVSDDGDDGDFNLVDDPTILNIAPVVNMDVIKTHALLIDINVDGVAGAGDVIRYTYVVENQGNLVLNDITPVDVHTGSGPALLPLNEVLSVDAIVVGNSTDVTANDGIWSLLSPGDSVSFTADYTVTQDDVDQLQ